VNFTVYPGSVTIVPPTTLDSSYQACGSGSPYDLNIQDFGGRGPFEHALDGSASNSGSSSESQFTLSGLNQGDYTLRITDADGNEQIKNIHISEINHPSVAIFPNDCASDPNGMAFLEDPIEGNYQIEWTYNDEKFYNVDTLRNLAGGEVFFSIINENNCPSPVRSVTIPNNGITVSHTVLDNPNCDGTPGSVRIEVTGGTAPYTIYHNGDSYYDMPSIELEILRETENFNISDDAGCAVSLEV